MVTLSTRIRSLRQERNLTQEDFGKIFGIVKSTVSLYESGKSAPNDQIKTEICRYFGVSMDYLLGLTETREMAKPHSLPQSDLFSPLPAMKDWPVLGCVACGQPLHREMEGETVQAPADIRADFVFRCVGESMIGSRIMDGDLVFVREEDVSDGEIAVVRVEDEYSLKRIYRGPDYLELRSENPAPAYRPIIIRGEQANVEIIGKAVFFLSAVI